MANGTRERYSVTFKKALQLDPEFPMLPFSDLYHNDCGGLFKYNGVFSGQDVHLCDKCNKQFLTDSFDSIKKFSLHIHEIVEIKVFLDELEPISKYSWVENGKLLYSTLTEIKGYDLLKYHYPNAVFKRIPVLDF